MSLTDAAVRNSKAAEKPVKLYDERGLYLEVSPSGGKWWRLKYRFQGKEKRLSLGVYPDVGLKEARDRRDAARKLLADGVDPSENRKAQKAAKASLAANTFEVIAREWYAKFSSDWGELHRDRVLRRLERDVFPWIGSCPISNIKAPGLLEVVQRVENRGALDTAHRVLSTCGQIFRYAVATGRAARDLSWDLRGALPPAKTNHFAATTDPSRLAELLRVMDGYNGTFIVKCALQLAPMLFVRPGELRKAEWAKVNLEEAEWQCHIKNGKVDHIVPLCAQALAILKELKPLTEGGKYVFPCARSMTRPMSENAVLGAMRRMGIGKEELTGHGFRAVARTILEEVLGVQAKYIEAQLGHAVKDHNGEAYNRTAFLHQREKMMQKWGDYLEKLKAGTIALPLRKNA